MKNQSFNDKNSKLIDNFYSKTPRNLSFTQKIDLKQLLSDNN